MNLDVLCPPYYGADRISVRADAGQTFLAGQPVRLSLLYDDCVPGGAVLPIVVTVQPAFGDGLGWVRREYRRQLPRVFSFTPMSAGDYLVVAREGAHNRWQGRLIVRIGGEPVDAVSLGEP